MVVDVGPFSCSLGTAEAIRRTWSGLTYLGDIANSSLSGSGSDHTRSAIGPSCGISVECACERGTQSSASFANGCHSRVHLHSRVSLTSESIYDLDLVYSVHGRR